MKTTTVPAQVTTVEDKIAGNLNLAQMLLLAASVFCGFGLYVLVPPNMKFSLPKFLLCLIVMLILASLAIRVRGKILALWLGVIFRYNRRPRYFIFNKNDTYLRDIETKFDPESDNTETTIKKNVSVKLKPAIPLRTIVQLESAVADPRARLAFETNKKGGLHVRITEIK